MAHMGTNSFMELTTKYTRRPKACAYTIAMSYTIATDRRTAAYLAVV